MIFLGFWFVPHTVVDMTAAVVAFVSFLAGAVIGGRFARHLEHDTRRWVTVALGVECVVLLTLSILAGTGVLDYHDNTKLILIAGLAVAFGSQNATARQFGIQELSTTVLTSTIVGIGVDSRLAGGKGDREKLRFVGRVDHVRGRGGRGDDVALHRRTRDRLGGGAGGGDGRSVLVRAAALRPTTKVHGYAISSRHRRGPGHR